MPSANSNSVKHYAIEPAKFRLDGGAMFGIIPKPLWNKVAAADDQNRIDLALRLWLIKTSDRLILVDTGIGDYHGDKFDSRFDVRGGPSPLVSALAQLNIKPEQITDLIISHLHFDHVGGIGVIKDDLMVPVFPAARCHVHSDHYDYSQSPTQRDSGSFHTNYFMPVLKYYEEKGLLNLHNGEEGTLFELENDKGNFLKFKCSHGHTPFLMHPYDENLIYMADLIPTSNHVSIPWVMGYDISPGITTVDKKSFLEFIDSKNLMMLFEHDPKYWGSRVSLNERGSYVVDQLQVPEELVAYPLNIS